MIIGTYNSKEDEPAAPAALNQDQTTAVTTTTEKSTSKIPLPSGVYLLIVINLLIYSLVNMRALCLCFVILGFSPRLFAQNNTKNKGGSRKSRY